MFASNLLIKHFKFILFKLIIYIFFVKIHDHLFRVRKFDHEPNVCNFQRIFHKNLQCTILNPKAKLLFKKHFFNMKQTPSLFSKFALYRRKRKSTRLLKLTKVLI